MALFSSEAAVDAYPDLVLEQNPLNAVIDINQLPTAPNAYVLLADLLEKINLINPTLLSGKIAEFAGFPTDTFIGPVDWNKLTYFILFKTFPQVPREVISALTSDNNYTDTRIPASDPQITHRKTRFEEWFNEINAIRWAVRNDGLVSTIKRITREGEEEYSTPTSATTPVIEADQYRTLEQYQAFELNMHPLFISENFDENGVTEIPIHLYMLCNAETPYFSQWLRKRKSIPFWALTYAYDDDTHNPVAVPPRPLTGTYTDVSVRLNNANERSRLYYGHRDYNNFNRYPRITAVVNPQTNSVTVRGFQEERVYVSLFDTANNNLISPIAGIALKYPSDDSPAFVQPKGQNKLILHIENSLTEKYFPDYKAKENFLEDWVYLENSNGVRRNFVKILRDTFTTNDVTISIPAGSTVTLADLINYPIIGSGTGSDKSFSIQFPVHPTNSNLQTTTNDLYSANRNQSHNTRSGLTLGFGIDMQNGITANATGQQILNNFLTAASQEWANFTNTERNAIYSIRGLVTSGNYPEKCIQANDSASIWFENRILFDRIDMNLGANFNFSTMITAGTPFLNENYLNKAVNLLRNGAHNVKLTADLNAIEKYVVVTLMWNLPGSILNNATVKTHLSNAINRHDYTILLQAVNAVSNANNNKRHVLHKLQEEVIKNYFRTVHLNTIAL